MLRERLAGIKRLGHLVDPGFEHRRFLAGHAQAPVNRGGHGVRAEVIRAQFLKLAQFAQHIGVGPCAQVGVREVVMRERVVRTRGRPVRVHLHFLGGHAKLPVQPPERAVGRRVRPIGGDAFLKRGRGLFVTSPLDQFARLVVELFRAPGIDRNAVGRFVFGVLVILAFRTPGLGGCAFDGCGRGAVAPAAACGGFSGPAAPSRRRIRRVVVQRVLVKKRGQRFDEIVGHGIGGRRAHAGMPGVFEQQPRPRELFPAGGRGFRRRPVTGSPGRVFLRLMKTVSLYGQQGNQKRHCRGHRFVHGCNSACPAARGRRSTRRQTSRTGGPRQFARTLAGSA